ncbi:MAG: tetratricopeptide repeat protein [Erysipelotrichales bacterium]|nr:tetratricopeptide repeat protein [Erysipelotrichales bacterium]
MSDSADASANPRTEYSLSYRTRGGKNPKGLPRVFFGAHPDDAAACFERVWKILDAHQDIALFFGTAPRTFKEFSEDLADMQLIVMAVTAKLLHEKPRDVMAILSIALEKHIPVLPLMFENGLASEFRQVFGDLQYLAPDDDDPTAIPFDQKLETYLNGVLVSTETAKRVRDAFDAYIFLSYRKKDRAYARRLMKLVHTDERLRDVAIWYDEFLTPGEDFNDAIRHVLKSSDLFALVVTPNLLERAGGKKNYVMEHEYPAAVEASKPIVPCEMAETDKTQLAKDYEGIGACISGEDGNAIPEVIAEKLKKEALKEDTPEHNFLIGLAYLDGIDVEVDHEKALRLIQGSAEAGVEEAIRKLIVMYHDGKGVARDYKESVLWQEKLVECIRRKQAEGAYTEDDPVLAYALGNLGDAWNEIGQPWKSREPYVEMYNEAARIQNTQLKIKSKMSFCDLCVKIGMAKEAKSLMEEVLPLLENAAKTNPTIRTRTELALCYEKIGRAEEKLGHFADAKTQYEKTAGIMEGLAKTGDIPSRRNLARIYRNIAETAHQLENPEETLNLQKAALAITEALEKETGTIASRRDLLLSYIRLGDTMDALKLPADAKAWYEKALPLSKALAEEAGTMEDRKNLGDVYQDLGRIARSLGNLGEAIKMHKQAYAVRSALVKDDNEISSRVEQALTCGDLGDILRDMKNPSQAKEWYEFKTGYLEVLIKVSAEYRICRELSAAYMKIGHAAKETGDLKEAVTWYEKALPVQENLWKETGEKEACDGLLSAYEYLGAAQAALKNPQDAKAAFEKAAAIREECAKKSPSETLTRGLITDYERLGRIFWDLKDPNGAAAQYQKALSLLEPSITETGNLWSRREAVSCYRSLGNLKIALGQKKEAAALSKKSLDTAKKLVDETNAEQDNRLLAHALYEMGLRNPVKLLARPVFKQAYNIWKDLAEEHPNVPEYAKMRDLAASKMRG